MYDIRVRKSKQNFQAKHTHTSKSEMRLRKETKDKEDTKKFITVEGYDSRTSKKN